VSNKCEEVMVKEDKVLGRFRWEIEEEKMVVVIGVVLYLTLMLGSVWVYEREGGDTLHQAIFMY
jgi:hypothetical protein